MNELVSENAPGFSAVRNGASAKSSVWASFGIVVGFWWAATGLTLAMQWSNIASTASVIVTTILAAVGAGFVWKSRGDATVAGARRAFLGGALVWWWCSSLFYAGVGIEIPAATTLPSGSFALALRAIQATLYADLIGVVALIVTGVAVRNSVNRMALWSLATFFGTLQTAKLNIFFGVRNSGVDWLPSHLAALSQFFGPPRNSPLLLVTVLMLTAIGISLARRARASHAPFQRHAYGMVAFLIALAIIEHVALGISTTLPLWNMFMARN